MEQHFALAHVGSHESEVEHLQVAQAAMDQAGWPRRGARSEIALLDKRYLESAQRKVAGDTRTDDAAADDQDVERAALDCLKRCVALADDAHACSLNE